jgi:hypothetical protein
MSGALLLRAGTRLLLAILASFFFFNFMFGAFLILMLHFLGMGGERPIPDDFPNWDFWILYERWLLPNSDKFLVSYGTRFAVSIFLGLILSGLVCYFHVRSTLIAFMLGLSIGAFVFLGDHFRLGNSGPTVSGSLISSLVIALSMALLGYVVRFVWSGVRHEE